MLCIHSKRIVLTDYDGTKIYKCSVCQLVFRAKVKKDLTPRQLYNNYYQNEVQFGRFKLGIEYLIRLFRFFRAFKIYTAYPAAKSILDIGSGRGFMLYFLKKYYGYTTTIGTQIEKKAYEFSKNRLGLTIYNQDLLKIKFKSNQLDLVTIWHVLEHVPDPEKYSHYVYQILTKNGKLVIEVPNYNSWTSRFTGKYWLGLDLKYHLYFFTRSSLVKLLTKYGFKIEKIRTFSLEYSAFISAQSVVSWLTKTDQLFFTWIQGGKFKPELYYHIILLGLLFPGCLLINLLLYFSNKGEVLLIIAKK